MNEQGAPGQTQTKKGRIQREEARTDNLRGIQIHCQSIRG